MDLNTEVSPDLQAPRDGFTHKSSLVKSDIIADLAHSPRSDDRVLAALATIIAECTEFDRLAGAAP
jgi:hypothetical protein